MFHFNLPRKLILKSRSVVLVGICVLVTLSCGSGVFQNFEGIRIYADPRVDRIDLRIYLVDRNGIPLIMESECPQSKYRCEHCF